MGPTWDIRDPLFQLRSMQLIEALYPWGQFDRIKAGILGLPGAPTKAYGGPRSGPLPPFVLVRSGEVAALFLTGVTTLTDGLSMFVTDSASAVSYKGVKLPALLLAAAQSFASMLEQPGFSGAGRLIVSGHSYGGSIAEVLAFVLTSTGQQPATSCLSFGAPRPGDQRFADRISGLPMLRVMAQDDPIPRFPPHRDEAPIVYNLLPSTATQWWEQWVQPGVGLVLDEGGKTTLALLPRQVLPIADVDLLRWAVTPYGFSSARHAAYHYVRRLEQRIAALPAPDTNAAPPPSSSTPVRIQSTSAPMPATSADKALSPDREDENMQGQNVPADMLARKQRIGENWSVVWMGRQVALGKSRTNAGSMASRLNAWLRRLVRVKAFPIASLGNSLGDFINTGVANGLFAANDCVPY